MPSLLRVLLDATAVPADRGGVGRYVDSLLPELDALGCRLVVAAQRRDAGAVAALAPHAEVLPAPRRAAGRPARLAWEQTGLPALVRRARVDVVHSPHYTMPLASGIPSVVTFHDATFFSDPGLHLAAKARFFRSWIRLSARRCAVGIADSHATLDELARHAGADPGRFVVAHLGVDHARFRPAGTAAQAAVREVLGLGEQPYVAFLGTLEPRKNLPALVRGFAQAVAGRPDPPALVLAGGRGWDDELDGALAEVRPHAQVVVPGYLPLELLAAYLSAAAVVAYPSLGEGFGLPVLEAMACGAPVLTTRLLALPEVGGDSVAYTEPDAGSIAQALGRLLDDAQEREQLGRAGLARAAGFTWRACAERHLEAYERAARR
jgi:glycosyltransferase involved in cell wall biosynthesis